MNTAHDQRPDSEAQRAAVIAESLLRVLTLNEPPAYLRPVVERLEQHDREVICSCREVPA